MKKLTRPSVPSKLTPDGAIQTPNGEGLAIDASWLTRKLMTRGKQAAGKMAVT